MDIKNQVNAAYDDVW